jgi:flagellar protein FliO/FliZ
MVDLNFLLLAVAVALFVIALGALMVWAFRVFVTGRASTQGFLRPRDKRLSVVETASVDARRKLLLAGAAGSSISFMIGGPVDMLIETGIKGRLHLEPPHEAIIIAKSETRPPPDSARNRGLRPFFD